jgi:hypothetical protein
VLVRPRLGDQRAHLLERHRLTDELPVALPLVDIFFALVVAAEVLFDELDLRQPFDRRDGVPPGDDDSERISVLDRERFAVHGVGQQRLGVPGIVELQAALEADAFRARVHRPAVSPPEEHFPRSGLDAGPIQDLDEGNSRPLGRAHRAQVPLLALDGWRQQRATVSRALEGHHERLGRHVLEITQAQAEWA